MRDIHIKQVSGGGRFVDTFSTDMHNNTYHLEKGFDDLAIQGTGHGQSKFMNAKRVEIKFPEGMTKNSKNLTQD